MKTYLRRVWKSALLGIASAALALGGAGALAQQGPGGHEKIMVVHLTQAANEAW